MAVQAMCPPRERRAKPGFLRLFTRSADHRGRGGITALLCSFLAAAVLPLAQARAQSSLCGEISTNTTLTAAGSPYLVTCSVSVPSGVTLTIEAGAVLKFSPAASLTVQGELQSKGTPSNPVVFTSFRDDEYGGDSNGDGPSSGQSGDWGGLTLFGGSYTVSDCLFRYGGSLGSDNGGGTVVPMLTTTAGFTGTIADNMFYAGAPYATRCAASCASFPGKAISVDGNCTITRNSITYLSKHSSEPYPYGIEVTSSQAKVTNNTITGAGTGVVVSGSTGGQVSNNVVSDATIGISLSSVASLAVSGNVITGSLECRIGIEIYATGPGCTVTENQVSGVRSVDVESGFGIDLRGTASIALFANGLQDCNYGVAVSGSAAAIGNNVFLASAAAGFPYYLRAEPWPTFSGGITLQPGWRPSVALGGSIGSDVTLGDIGGFGFSCVSIPSSLSIEAGGTLRLPAGKILKLSYRANLYASGTLLSQGTPSNPVVFTSFRDDEYGGDSNGDGPSSGQSGDWGGLTLFGGSYTLSDCLFRYGGSLGNDAGGGTVTPLLAATAGFTGTIADNMFYAGAPYATRCAASCASFPGKAISVDGNCTITRNSITYLSKHGSLGYPYGIHVTSSQAQVTDNTVAGAGTAIVVSGSTGGQVGNNVIDQATVGMSFSSISGLAVIGNRLQGDASSTTGILIDPAGPGNGLSDNWVLGPVGVGIDITGLSTAPLSVSECLISGSSTSGIRVRAAAPIITGCSFQSNAAAVSNEMAVQIEATGNWWGDATGPRDSSPGPPDFNPDGAGDPVSDNVVYRPWLTESPAFHVVTEPDANTFWLTGGERTLRVSWKALPQVVDHIDLSYALHAEDGQPLWRALATVRGTEREWTGTAQLALADTVGAKVRLKARAAGGDLLLLGESEVFAAGHEGSIRLDVQRWNHSVFSPPVLFWNLVPGAARYSIYVTADQTTSCRGGSWQELVNAPRRYVAFDQATWETFPATRCNVTVTALSSGGTPIGDRQTMTFVRFKLSDLHPELTDPGTSRPPVLLIHGWTADQDTWFNNCNTPPWSKSPLDSALIDARDGERFHTWALEYPNIEPIAHSAFGLKAAVDYLLVLPNQADSVRLVAHSMGGLVCRTYLVGLAVDPADDPNTGLPVGGSARVSHLVTLSSPHLGEPWFAVDAGAAWHNTIAHDCLNIAASSSVRDMSSSGPFIARLNAFNLRPIRYFFAGGRTPYDELGGRLRDSEYSAYCPTGNDGTVDLCSARADCGVRYSTGLTGPTTGGYIVRAQYTLGHRRMALPGNVHRLKPGCSGLYEVDRYAADPIGESGRLLGDVVGFLRCGSCLVTSDCPGENRRVIRHRLLAKGAALGLPSRSAGATSPSPGGVPVVGASVAIRPVDADEDDAGILLSTDVAGIAACDLVPGRYLRRVSAGGFRDRTDTLVVSSGGGEISLVSSLAVDTTYVGPKNPSLFINGGAATVPDSSVMLSLACDEAVEMSIAESLDLVGGSWQPLQPVLPLILRGGPGVHEVVVLYRDAGGKTAGPVSALVRFTVGGFGSLHVTTASQPAEIVLDGRPMEQMTPATLTAVPEGFHSVSVIADGYRTSEGLQAVLVRSDETAEAPFALVAAAPPSEATWSSPSDNAFVGAARSFVWHPAFDSDPGDIIAYECDVYSDSPSQLVFSEDGILDTTLAIPMLRDSASYFATIGAIDSHGMTQVQPLGHHPFRLDTTPPVGVVRRPQADDVLRGEGSAALVVDAHDWGGLLRMKALLSVDGGRSYVQTLYDSTFTDSVIWSVPNVRADSCRIDCTLADSAGNDAAVSSVGWFSISEGIVAVQPSASPAAPRFSLWPAPASANVRMHFELSTPATAQLRIYDVAGRLVRHFVWPSMRAGTFDLEWDRLTDRGSPCSAGIYFVGVAVGSACWRQRLILLR